MTRSQLIALALAATVVAAIVGVRLVGTDSDSGSVAAGATGSSGDSSDSSADGADSPTGSEAEAGGDSPPTTEPTEAPPILDDKPDLVDIDGWLNTDATSLDDFAGQVTIVEFWTFGCFNCKNRLPHTQELYADYRDRGLEIVGVHAPEFEYERDPVAVAEAAEELGVTWPIALDTEKTNFRTWQGSRRFWPRVYVFDQDGQLRYDHIGEGDYDGLEAVVDHLITYGP
jgi:thiol-disulfide isomerase/thioredoxin